MRGRTVTIAAVMGISAALAAQELRMDGRWEVKTEMSMQGMPAGMNMPATTTTQCVTKEEATDVSKAIQPPAGRGGQQSDCKMTDHKISGNKITYTMTCTTPQAMTATGEAVYTGDTYTSTMTMNMSMPGRGGGAAQPVVMTTKATGKRLGDCTK
jgi:hypothetical protein